MAPTVVASVTSRDNLNSVVQAKPTKSWADVVRCAHEEAPMSEEQQEKLLALTQLKGNPEQNEDDKVTSDGEETIAGRSSAYSCADSDFESPMSPTLSETSRPPTSSTQLPVEPPQAPDAQRRSSLRSTAALFVPGALSQHMEATSMQVPSTFPMIRPPPGLDPPASVSVPPARRTPLRAKASYFVPTAVRDQCS